MTITKQVLAGLLGLASTSMASAITVSCTVTSGTVLTATGGGLSYSIVNGIGTSTGGATGAINCPAVTVGGGGLFITGYQVLATVDYGGGPFGTTSGTTVSEVLTLVGGPLNGSAVNASISGGASSSAVVPPVPFQIGSTLSGATSYGGFTVNVASSVTAGGPVGGSFGQVAIAYSIGAVPEPESLALMLAGLGVVATVARRRAATAR